MARLTRCYCRYSLAHSGIAVRPELFLLGMWEPRPAEEAAAARRAARGRQPAWEPMSAEVPDRDSRSTGQRR